MKQIIFAMSVIAALLVSCTSEPASDGAAASGQTESEATPATVESEAKEATKTGQRDIYQPAQSEEVLYLSFTDASAQAGEEVCIPLTAKGFTQLLSNQYTVSWNPDVLQFGRIRDLNMPKLSLQNFGTTQTDKGVLPFVWIDPTLQGVSIPDGQPLYTICFEAIGKSGQDSEVQLVEQPTAFEVVTVKEELQKLSPQPGRITIN